MPSPRHSFRSIPPVPRKDEPVVRSALVGLLRWAFLPLGLMALVAVGVHAAADTVDDRLLWLVERASAAVEGLLGGWGPAQGWGEPLGPELRLKLARGLTLVWELAADLVLALPVFGYQGGQEAGRRLWARLRARPGLMHLVRPLAAAAVCLAGACAVARMVQGAVFLSAEGALGNAAGTLARALALAVLAGVLASLGSRAVLGTLQHACDVAEEGRHTLAVALARGLWGSALVVPLAVAALLDASPVLSFLR